MPPPNHGQLPQPESQLQEQLPQQREKQQKVQQQQHAPHLQQRKPSALNGAIATVQESVEDYVEYLGREPSMGMYYIQVLSPL